MDEKEKADMDLKLFGRCFMKDGKHIPIQEVYYMKPDKIQQIKDWYYTLSPAKRTFVNFCVGIALFILISSVIQLIGG